MNRLDFVRPRGSGLSFCDSSLPMLGHESYLHVVQLPLSLRKGTEFKLLMGTFKRIVVFLPHYN